jgi:8-oxo-dGTP pyrophosphatase MutT (NUDIX family)
MESFDSDTKVCAERELKEETGLIIQLNDSDLYRIILDNCYVYKICVENMDIINLDNLENLDSTGIGWVDLECAFDFNLNFLTRKVVMGYTQP